MLIGFEAIKSTILESYKNNKLHHATLFYGKKGIGKATFVKALALEILASQSYDKISGKISGTISGTHHPDLLLIEKQEGKRDIVVDQIRKISEFINQTSAISKDKFIVIDAADDLNRAASNALLKILEEPHQNNFLILISHNPSKLLPTIKSRCQLIKINDLTSEDFTKILSQNILKFSPQETKILSEMCDNSPARAIDIGRDLIEFYESFLNSIKTKKLSDEILAQIADKNFNFEIFCEVITFFFHRLSLYKTGQSEYFIFDEKEVFAKLSETMSTEKIFDLSSAAAAEMAKVNSLNLDKKLMLVNVFNRIECRI